VDAVVVVFVVDDVALDVGAAAVSSTTCHVGLALVLGCTGIRTPPGICLQCSTCCGPL
jgi:hypothetical protein